jgi:hypothetical protein
MKNYQPKLIEKKISFDFDGTLDDDFGGEHNPQKEEIQNLCKRLIEMGKDVCIITKRYGNGMGETDKVYKLALELGVKNCYFTNRELKDQKVKELGIEVHFENNPQEAEIIKFNNPECLVVCIEDPYWRDLVY